MEEPIPAAPAMEKSGEKGQAQVGTGGEESTLAEFMHDEVGRR